MSNLKARLLLFAAIFALAAIFFKPAEPTLLAEDPWPQCPTYPECSQAR